MSAAPHNVACVHCDKDRTELAPTNVQLLHIQKNGKTLGHPQNHGFKSWSNDWDDVGLPPCLGKSPLEKLNPKVARMAHSQHFAKFLSQAHPSISA